MKKIHILSLIMLSSLTISGCSIPFMGGEEKETVPVTPPTTEETTPVETPPKPVDTKETPAELPPATPPQEESQGSVPSDTPKGIVEGGVYLPYTSTALAQGKGDIVLFFHASWCPTCIKINKNIEENLKKIPKDLTILKVNFDDAKELRETYEVTEQHTFVQVDNSGKLIKKWRGDSMLTDIVAQVQDGAIKADGGKN